MFKFLIYMCDTPLNAGVFEGSNDTKLLKVIAELIPWSK